MSERVWTPAQRDAIKTKYRSNGESCNLLVSAAAGSGKTAVLTRRVIEKLLPENGLKPVSIDKLLIVTFTNAAAREMAERIGAALSSELEKASQTGDEAKRKLIKKQQLLLSVSDITTIDAFCLKLLREHFNVLDLAPDFSIVDSAQAEILSQEAMEELFTQLYEENDREFLDLLCLYASQGSDDGLSRLVRHIYKFTRAIPYPIKWLYEKADELLLPYGIKNSAWFIKGHQDMKNQLSYALSLVKDGLFLMSENTDTDLFISQNPPKSGVFVFDTWRNAYKAFFLDYEFLKNALNSDYDGISKLFEGFSFSTLTFPKNVDENLQNQLKTLRRRVKDIVSSLTQFALLSLSDTENRSRNILYPTALALVRLVEKYDRIFTEKKLNKNLLEFHDAEQLCAQLLSENPDIAKKIQEKYSEVLMDEYQDTSLLQEEIFKYVTDGSNLFMVGDMKQSIYRFRNSDPIIFKRKNDEYSIEADSPNRKIYLSKNFRSRAQVLDSINDIFSCIMSEEAGELTYDADQMLYLGNTEYETSKEGYTSECIIIEAPDKDGDIESEEDMTSPSLEARLVAQEINRMKAEHFKVLDHGVYRDIENRDIVILMSSYKSSAGAYTYELQSAGIECFVESIGYFEHSEVRTILSLLKTISNPYSDIPLLAVLRSPIADFSDDELAIIRSIKKGRFFGAVKEIIKKNNLGELPYEFERTANKAERFCERLAKWREYSRYMSSDKLIWRLYEETDYYAFVGAMHDGEEAQANLRLLFQRAKQYEEGGWRGLFNFVKYMEHIEKKDTDLSSANLVSNAHNVVRIMTIHKSKGLEFPVVFLTGCAKRFNKRNEESRVMLHKDYGIAMDYIDFENSFRAETPQKAVFKKIQDRELVSEEIRKLYVAVTRAREKLFVVATVSGNTDKSGQSTLDKKKEKWLFSIQNSSGRIPADDVLSASGFIDWVAPVALTSSNWTFRTINYSCLAVCKSKEENPCEFAPLIDIEHVLGFTYPYSEVSDMPTKVSVSELKHKQETELVPTPAFLTEAKPDGAYYGTALHKVMQHLTPMQDMSISYINDSIMHMTQDKIMSEAEARLINPQRILDFYNSGIGQRILKSSIVLREKPFELEISANEIYPDKPCAFSETILLQGVIDCFFFEDDEVVLVDYKTDRYNDISEIHEKYDRQLSLYRYAIEKITGKHVKESVIYLFSTGEWT